MPFPKSLSRSTSFFTNTLLLVGGSGFSQFVLAATAPLLTRLYAPADFGVYAVLQSLANFAAAVASLRYETAIMLPRTDRAAANVAVLSFAAVGLLSLLTVPVTIVAWRVLGGVRGVRIPFELAMLVPLSIAALGVQQVLRSWFLRSHMFAAVTVLLVVQAVVMVGLQIAAGFAWGSQAFYLAAASLLGTVVSTFVVLPALRREGLGRLRQAISRRRLAAVARRYRRFPLYTAPFSFIAQITQRGPILLLALLAGPAATGAFALAQRTIYLPITVVITSLSQAFYRRAAGKLHDPVVHGLVRRVLLALVLLAGPLFILTAFDMPGIFAFVFGAAWREAGRYGAWLALAAFAMSLTFWLDRVFEMQGRQRLALVLETAFNLVCLPLLALVLYGTRSVEYTVIAFSMLSILYNLLYLGVSLDIARIERRLLFETVAAALAVVLYSMAIHYGLRALTDDDMLYAALAAALAMPPVVLGILIALGRIVPPRLAAARATSA
ncbi:MAG: oligosaccharide flippase family protein [Rhizomicrobium sp.]